MVYGWRGSGSADIIAGGELGNTWEWRYDDAGLLEDALDRVTAYAYNEEDQMVETSFPSSTEPDIDRVYDDAGRLITATRGDIATAYEYDARDQTKKETQTIGVANHVLNYEYDRSGRLTSLKLPGNTTANAYTYDAASRTTSVKDSRNNLTNYEYDTAGRLNKIDYPGTNLDQTQSYNAAGEMEVIAQHLGSAPTRTLTYGYDKNGNTTSLSDVRGTTLNSNAQFTYDDLDRLTRESYYNGSTTPAREYTYDAAGNRTNAKHLTGATVNANIGYTYNAAERMLTSGTTTYVHNANGERTSETTGSTTQTYGYTRQGEQATLGPNISSTGGRKNSYDAFGRKALQVQPMAGAPTSNTSSVYQGQQRVQYRSGSSKIFEEVRSPAGTLATRLWSFRADYQFSDALGSTTQATSGGATPQSTYSYYAFGGVRAASGATLQSQYLGNRSTDPIHHLDFNARVYEPEKGRFLSEDPVEGPLADPITQHPYAYGGNNPSSNPDPTGRSFWGDLDAASEERYLEEEENSQCNYYLHGRPKPTDPDEEALAVTGLSSFDCAVLGHTQQLINFKNALPVITFSRKKYPSITKNMKKGFKIHGNLFHRETDRKIQNANRRISCPQKWSRPNGMTCEEFPFASTKEGGEKNGKKATTAWVPKLENSSQGGYLGGRYGQYNKRGIGDGDAFTLSISP